LIVLKYHSNKNNGSSTLVKDQDYQEDQGSSQQIPGSPIQTPRRKFHSFCPDTHQADVSLDFTTF
jgi:hypothetical protein